MSVGLDDGRVVGLDFNEIEHAGLPLPLASAKAALRLGGSIALVDEGGLHVHIDGEDAGPVSPREAVELNDLRQQLAPSTPDLVTLHSGVEAHDGLVKAVMLGINGLLDSGKMIVAYEAVCLARSPLSHRLFGRVDEDLRELGWLDPASDKPRLHKSIADILVNIGNGDGIDMTFVDPRRRED